MLDRLKTLSLWKWGLICILAGLVSNQIVPLLGLSSSPRTAAGQASEAGRAAAGFVFMVAGVILIGVYFLRKKPRLKGKKGPPVRRRPPGF